MYLKVFYFAGYDDSLIAQEKKPQRDGGTT